MKMKLLNELFFVDNFLKQQLEFVKCMIDDEKRRIEESVLVGFKKGG